MHVKGTDRSHIIIKSPPNPQWINYTFSILEQGVFSPLSFILYITFMTYCSFRFKLTIYTNIYDSHIITNKGATLPPLSMRLKMMLFANFFLMLFISKNNSQSVTVWYLFDFNGCYGNKMAAEID